MSKLIWYCSHNFLTLVNTATIGHKSPQAPADFLPLGDGSSFSGDQKIRSSPWWFVFLSSGRVINGCANPTKVRAERNRIVVIGELGDFFSNNFTYGLTLFRAVGVGHTGSHSY